jgi:hypothetical protein
MSRFQKPNYIKNLAKKGPASTVIVIYYISVPSYSRNLLVAFILSNCHFHVQNCAFRALFCRFIANHAKNYFLFEILDYVRFLDSKTDIYLSPTEIILSQTVKNHALFRHIRAKNRNTASDLKLWDPCFFEKAGRPLFLSKISFRNVPYIYQ